MKRGGKRGRGRGKSSRPASAPSQAVQPPTDAPAAPTAPAAPAVIEDLPTPDEYRWAGSGKVVPRILTADELFRDTVLPGIAARYKTREEILEVIQKLAESAKQCHAEANSVLRHYERLHGAHATDSLLTSRKPIEAVFRAVLDSDSKTSPERISDNRLRAAVVAHRRFGLLPPLYRPEGSDEFYLDVADALFRLVCDVAERKLPEYFEQLDADLMRHFIPKFQDTVCQKLQQKYKDAGIKPPAAIGAIKSLDVQRVEAWLRAGIALGLEKWDTVLRVKDHFLKPEHVWTLEPADESGANTTRRRRWFVGPIFAIEGKFCIFGYEGGVRPTDDTFILPPEDLQAIVARIDEWRAHEDQLSQQLKSLSIRSRRR
ncbi:hypothetical protein H9P43_002174 [Blastocladiella emersonii ATCC 22665]|nr:hypothetical protein H9P43_002174 [Blastocladiella emersonii ATCC 22665]